MFFMRSIISLARALVTSWLLGYAMCLKRMFAIFYISDMR